MQHVASKIAFLGALLSGATALLTALVTGISMVYPLLAAVVVGAGVYVVVRRQVTGRLRRVDATLSALRDEGGRRNQTSELTGDEIDRLVRKGDQARYAVQKRMADLSRVESYRREYVGDVSHEIKTPIFAIQGFAETLLNGALDDPEVNRGFVQKILRHAARLNALAKDLAEISRLETGALTLQRGPFDAERVFEEVKESLEHVLREKEMELIIDVEPQAEWIDGDRDRMRQVVMNLADNAVKYNDRGGRVWIRALRDGDRVRLCVEDDGIGIEPDDLPRVTERFYRADKSRSRAQGGTGLGLSIVKHILSAHDARLDIDSTPGIGSTFSFALRAAEASATVETPYVGDDAGRR